MVAQMELKGTVSIPVPYHEQSYTLTPDELKRLWFLKLINDRCYIYLALHMTYSHASPSVDIPSFSEAWDISEESCRVAIAALGKKGMLEPLNQQLELNLFGTMEAIANEDAEKEANKQK